MKWGLQGCRDGSGENMNFRKARLLTIGVSTLIFGVAPSVNSKETSYPLIKDYKPYVYRAVTAADLARINHDQKKLDQKKLDQKTQPKTADQLGPQSHGALGQTK